MMFLSESTSGILEIIKRKCLHLSKETKNRSSNVKLIDMEVERPSINVSKLEKLKEIGLLIIIASIDLSSSLVLSISIDEKFREIDSLTSLLRGVQVIFLGILSFFILSLPIYRFHIVCFFGTFILLVFLLILEYFNEARYYMEISNYLGYIGIYLLCYLVNSLQYVLHRYLMDKYLYSPYMILCLMGVIGSFLTILLMCIGTLANIDKISFASARIGWDKMFSETHYIFCLIGVYVLGLLINLCMILINFYLTPGYNGIGDTLCGVLMMVKVLIKKSTTISVFIVLILIFALFICMIYFELIVLRCFSFGVDTRNEIGKREINEMNLIGIFIKERKSLKCKENKQINPLQEDIN